MSLTKHREFTGPTPHSVAILAKPTSKRPADHLILERRRVEDLREQSIADSKYNKQCDLKSAWERATDKRIRKNLIDREMQGYFQKESMKLEMRREKLRDMLLREEEQYIQEMEALEETVEERQNKMKERAKYLKEKRETERKNLVAEKLDQKFREECEELRGELSKRNRDQIFTDRQEQINMKADAKFKEEDIEAFYADMWQHDTMAKAEREEIEMQQQIERSRSALEILNIQRKAVETQREEEKLVKHMEAEWLKEESALRAYEEELLKKEKKEKQRGARRARDISIKLKDRKEAKEKQEQIAMDMKILDKIITDTQNEAVEDLSKKKQMREEMQRFMHYVEKTRKEESDKDKLINELINDDVEEQWKKKDERKKMEKVARKTLLNNVLKTREIQIREREDLLKHEQVVAMKEREELLNQMEEHRRLENEKIHRIRKENRQYQNDLEQQLAYQRSLKDKEIAEARKELNSLNNEEVKYQKRLRSALDRPDIRKMHPLRITGITCMNDRAKTC